MCNSTLPAMMFSASQLRLKKGQRKCAQCIFTAELHFTPAFKGNKGNKKKRRKAKKKNEYLRTAPWIEYCGVVVLSCKICGMAAEILMPSLNYTV